MKRSTIIIALLVLACFGIVLWSALMPRATQSQQTAQAHTLTHQAAPHQSTPKSQPTKTVQSAKPKRQPVKPTPTPSHTQMPKVAALVNHYEPYIGGALSTFTKTFGTPSESDDTGAIWSIDGDTMQSFQIGATNGKVTDIDITTAASVTWSTDQATVVAFGTLFLPSDAYQTNITFDAQFERIEYSSHYGKITLLVNHGADSKHWTCWISLN